ncbi:hypothetical protein [Erythrobacter sp.]|uniref:hypothetical protein n=1 Tax=Erythrobacter sp. TaxID=1042 RepID=UPI0025D126F7|nr:hypothetical protein [Erythrobacter sp.]
MSNSRSFLLMVGLALVALLLGPVVFFGLFAPEGGLIAGLKGNFLLFVAVVVGAMLAWWLAVLAIGHAASKQNSPKDSKHG